MANVVEYLVKIRDLASGQMRSFANASEGALNRITNRTRTVGNSIDQLNSRIDALTKTRNMSLDTRQIERANREIDKLEAKRDKLESSGRRSGGGLGMMGGALLAGGVALAGAGLVTSMKAGMERQMASTSFEVMAGKSQGDKLHKNLMGFATDTIYGNEVFGEAKTLLGFGVQAQNIMPTLKMLGDVAMGDAERMKGLSLVFAQTSAAGKLTGSDMLQYINAGFNPLQAISEKTGRSMAKLKQDVTDGKISFKDVAGAFQYATGPMGRFHNGMKKMGETPTGKWMAFTGALQTFAGTVGTGLLPLLGGVTSLLSGLLSNEPLLYGLAAGVGAMAGAWALYTLWTKRAVIWQGVLAVVAYWPIALIGAAIGLVTYLAVKYESWGNSAKAAWNISKAMFSDLKTGLLDFGQTIAYAFEMALLKVKNVFQTAGAQLGNLRGAWDKIKQGDFGGAKAALLAPIDTDADKRMRMLRTEHNFNRSQNRSLIDSNNKEILAQSKLIHFDTKNGKDLNLKGKATDWLNSTFNFGKGGAGSGAPGSVADAAKGIAGGGVRSVTINIAKQGIDSVTINTATLKEGTDEIKRQLIELLNQVVNSGNSIIPAN